MRTKLRLLAVLGSLGVLIHLGIALDLAPVHLGPVGSPLFRLAADLIAVAMMYGALFVATIAVYGGLTGAYRQNREIDQIRRTSDH